MYLCTVFSNTSSTVTKLPLLQKSYSSNMLVIIKASGVLLQIFQWQISVFSAWCLFALAAVSTKHCMSSTMLCTIFLLLNVISQDVNTSFCCVNKSEDLMWKWSCPYEKHMKLNEWTKRETLDETLQEKFIHLHTVNSFISLQYIIWIIHYFILPLYEQHTSSV